MPTSKSNPPRPLRDIALESAHHQNPHYVRSALFLAYLAQADRELETLTQQAKTGKSNPMATKKTTPKSNKGKTMAKARANSSAAEQLHDDTSQGAEVHNIGEKPYRLVQVNINVETYNTIKAWADADRRKVSPFLSMWIEDGVVAELEALAKEAAEEARTAKTATK